MICMNYEEFWDTFKPVTNHIDDNAAYEGCMFETFGDELKHVLKKAEDKPGHVWTIMEGDDGEPFIGDGYHIVNRIGYLITEVPCPEDCEGVEVTYDWD